MADTAFDTTLSNLGITRYTGTANSTASGAAKSGVGKTTLDQSDFLTLMTAQLKNQDPFAPMDNTQMVAQMAQFSSLSGITEMSSTLSGIATKLGATSTADALSYVGKTVLTEGSTAYPRTGGGIAGAVELDGVATDVQVSISDANGGVLKTLSLGAQPAGTASYDWDGTDGAGNPVGGGPYTVSVLATNSNGQVAARSLVWAPVESVSLPSGGSPALQVTGIGAVAPAAVRSAA